MTRIERFKNTAVVILTAAFLLTFCAWSLIQPDKAISTSERRPLATTPSLNRADVLSGAYTRALETYSLDQFPLRDGFRQLRARVSRSVLRQRDINGIYLREGYAAKLDAVLHADFLAHAADRFRFVYETYLAGSDARVYLSVIPDKNFFLAEKNGYPAMDYEQMFETLRAAMPYAAYLDIAGLLSISDYYKTDTHWRQEALVPVAQALCAGMGVPCAAAYEQKLLAKPFFGLYVGQSALPLPGEPLIYLENETLRGCRVFDYEENAYIGVYDLEKGAGRDPYELFLSGSKSLLRIENPSAATDRALVVFRDSFGSSLAPLLAEGYASITLVDIRYLSSALLGRFLTFDAQDVLFLYSTSVLNNSVTLK